MNDINKKDLISLIFTATRLIRERTAGHGKFDPFSIAQCKVLAFVAENNLPTMKDVAGFLYITSPSATAIINQLVKAGEIQRIYDQEDRRIVRLRLTEKGDKALVERRKEVSARMSKVLESLTEKDKESFAEILTKIINNK